MQIVGDAKGATRRKKVLWPLVVVPKFGCPRFGAFWFVRLTWETTRLIGEQNHAVRRLEFAEEQNPSRAAKSPPAVANAGTSRW